jgi:hypothetical protein
MTFEYLGRFSFQYLWSLHHSSCPWCQIFRFSSSSSLNPPQIRIQLLPQIQNPSSPSLTSCRPSSSPSLPSCRPSSSPSLPSCRPSSSPSLPSCPLHPLMKMNCQIPSRILFLFSSPSSLIPLDQLRVPVLWFLID